MSNYKKNTESRICILSHQQHFKGVCKGTTQNKEKKTQNLEYAFCLINNTLKVSV